MRLLLGAFCVVALLFYVTNAEEEKSSWSWGGKEKEKETEKEKEIGQIEGRSSSSESKLLEEEINLNDSEAEGIIDEILSSTRQGRNLQGYDEVYTDPDVQEALQKGDESEARNVIKERLCALGLMQCDNAGKRPYLSPEDLIYAQPVALKPVGRPIATIPVRGPPRPYGSPRPVPFPPGSRPPISHGPPGSFGPPSSFGPPASFGPPRPIPSIPPRRGYNPQFPSKPPGQYFSQQSSSFGSGSFSSGGPSFASKPLGPIYNNGPVYSNGPIEIEEPYQFDNIKGPHKINPVGLVVNGQGGATISNGVQNHVHHHFHHGEDGAVKIPLVVTKPVLPSQGHISTANGILTGETFIGGNGGFAPGNSFGGFKESSQTSATFGSSTGLGSYASNVKPVVENYSPQTFGSSGSGLYTNTGSVGNSGTYASNFGTNSFGANSFNSGASGSNSFGANSFNSGASGSNSFGSNPFGTGAGSIGANTFGANSIGASVGQYGSTSPFYKKELNLNTPLNGNSIQSAYGQSSYADKFQSFQSGRGENYDCVCVPFDQCPIQHVIGRKDDLYLPLDPRNLKTDILAEDVVLTDGNGTMTIVRIAKNATLPNETNETKKLSKREAVEKNDKEEIQEKSKVEPRRQYLDNYGNGNSGLLDKKIQPTFGVSFGLPQHGGGYPLNPFSANPTLNPYGNVIGGGGINLGLVSVNPLVSFQVTKNDEGEKVFKPLVNLHVTPNDFLVHKIGGFFHKRKEALHQHLHHHSYPPPPFYNRRPPYYNGPPIYHKPPFNHGPIHYDGPNHYGPPHEPIHYDGPNHYGPGPIPHGPGPISYGTGPTSHGPGPIPYGSGPIFHGPGPISHGSGPIPEPFTSPAYHGPPHYESSVYPGPPNIYRDRPAASHDRLPQYFIESEPSGLSDSSIPSSSFFDDTVNNYGGAFSGGDFGAFRRIISNNTGSVNGNNVMDQYNKRFQNQNFFFDQPGINLNHNNGNQLLNGQKIIFNQPESPNSFRGGKSFSFPVDGRSDKTNLVTFDKVNKRQAYYNGAGRPGNCGPRHVCCRRPNRPVVPNPGYNGRQCGVRHQQGINGRVKNPSYIDGDSEFGEYPWQVAILKKDPKESVYVCGGTLIDAYHIITAAHCVKTYNGFDLRVRLGEWDVNHDVEFYPYIERDITAVHVHPQFYAGTLYNDLAVLRMDKPVDFSKSPHITPACMPDPYADYTGTRCWTTGWGKDGWGEHGKYQNILKEVDVPIVQQEQCQAQMKQTRLGYDFKLHPGFICAGGEEGKDACKGDGGGPMVCERGGSWQVVGVVSWGIGCGQYGVPGVYVRVAHYLDWIKQIVSTY